MKNLISIIFILLISQITFGQDSTTPYKFDEYEDVGVGCQEYFRMDAFVGRISQQEGSRGLIVLYTGENADRFGNILGHISGTKQFLKNWMGFPPERILFTVVKGKKFFNKELWIIPKNAKVPDIKSFEFDWNNLETKYFFSTTCFMCDPSYGLLTTFQPDFEDYTEVLKKYPNYRGQIIVNNFQDLFQVRRTLTKEYKLPTNRFSIQLAKRNKGKEESYSVDLYLVPNKTK
jgi:hypothetical protein